MLLLESFFIASLDLSPFCLIARFNSTLTPSPTNGSKKSSKNSGRLRLKAPNPFSPNSFSPLSTPSCSKNANSSLNDTRKTLLTASTTATSTFPSATWTSRSLGSESDTPSDPPSSLNAGNVSTKTPKSSLSPCWPMATLKPKSKELSKTRPPLL